MYAVLFEDNEEFVHMRRQHMAAHLDFLSQHATEIVAAGPMFDARSGVGAGGLWLVRARDAASVQQLIEADPFWSTGLRKTIHIREWKQVFADGVRLMNA